MSDPLTHRLQEMRESFDHGFTLPIESARAQGEHFLAIKVGERPLALRIHDIHAIAHVTRIIPVPSPVPELLGLVGRRGELVPLYDLSALLEYPPAGHTPRWYVQIGEERPLGLAFDRLEGYHIAEREEAIDDEANATTGRHAVVMIRLDGVIRPVIDLKGLVDSLQRRLQPLRPEKE